MEVYAKSVVTDTIISNQYLLLYVPVFIFSNILSVQTRVGELVGKGVISFHIDVYLPVLFMCHHFKAILYHLIFFVFTFWRNILFL